MHKINLQPYFRVCALIIYSFYDFYVMLYIRIKIANLLSLNSCKSNPKFHKKEKGIYDEN